MVTNAFQLGNDVKDIGEFYQRINKRLDDIERKLTKDTLDIDIYGNEPNATELDLSSVIRTPWICTQVIATWTTGSNIVSLQIKDRVISNGSNANKSLIFDCRMQIGPHDPIKLLSNNACGLFLEMMGYADYKKIDRQDKI